VAGSGRVKRKDEGGKTAGVKPSFFLTHLSHYDTVICGPQSEQLEAGECYLSLWSRRVQTKNAACRPRFGMTTLAELNGIEPMTS
jgi:hypothetical protein